MTENQAQDKQRFAVEDLPTWAMKKKDCWCHSFWKTVNKS